MNFPDKKSVNAKWEFTSDHSKWAITGEKDKNAHWTCVGDINRMKSQFKRGGGVVCLKNDKVWKAFKSIIAATESCN